MKCGRQLTPLELVPVFSYLFLKGRCKGCGEPISPRYMLVELLTGTVYLWVYLRYGLSIETLALIYLLSVLLILFFIDLDHMLIPDSLIVTGLLGGSLLYTYFLLSQVWHVLEGPAYLFYDPDLWYTPLLGMLSSSAVLLVVALVGFLIYGNEGAMGMGDVKLFLPIGLFLGWKLCLLALFIAVICGGIRGIFLIFLHRANRKSEIPFGSFIVLGAFLSSLYGNELLGWYLALLK